VRVQLDTPNPALPPESLQQIDANNVKALSQAINKTGVALLLDKQTNTATNFTSTSYVVPLGMEGVFTSSGGYIEASFKTTISYSGVSFIQAQLLIDDKVYDFTAYSLNIVGGQLFLSFQGKLGAGRHYIKILALVGAGTAGFSTSGSLTALQVKETLL
jgi:hypothetical protein